MLRVRLCEFVASEFGYRYIKNIAAKGEGGFIKPTGIKHGLLHRILSIKLEHCTKFAPSSSGHDALNNR